MVRKAASASRPDASIKEASKLIEHCLVNLTEVFESAGDGMPLFGDFGETVAKIAKAHDRAETLLNQFEDYFIAAHIELRQTSVIPDIGQRPKASVTHAAWGAVHSAIKHIEWQVLVTGAAKLGIKLTAEHYNKAHDAKANLLDDHSWSYPHPDVLVFMQWERVQAQLLAGKLPIGTSQNGKERQQRERKELIKKQMIARGRELHDKGTQWKDVDAIIKQEFEGRHWPSPDACRVACSRGFADDDRPVDNDRPDDPDAPF